MRIAYILFIGIGFSCATQLPSTSVASPEVSFEVHHNILIVEGYVNDKWAKFIVDTGASTSLLDMSQSKKYKFSYAFDPEARLTGFGGRSQLMKTSTVAFSLKGLSGGGYRFSASDLKGLNTILAKNNQRVLGIIGSDILKHHGAIIDYSQNKIVFTNSY